MVREGVVLVVMGREHRRVTSRITTQPVVDKFTTIDEARADLRSKSRLCSPHLASMALVSPHQLGSVRHRQCRCAEVMEVVNARARMIVVARGEDDVGAGVGGYMRRVDREQRRAPHTGHEIAAAASCPAFRSAAMRYRG